MDPSVRTAMRRGLLLAVGVIIGCGLVAFVGWHTWPVRLHTMLPQLAAMKMFQCLGLPLGGISLWLWLRPQDPCRTAAAQLLGGVITFIALVSAAYSVYWYFSPDAAAAVAGNLRRVALVTVERRGSFTTIVSLLFAGMALCLLDYRTRRGTYPAECLALLAILMPFAVIVGFLYSGRNVVQLLGNPGVYPGMVLYNAIGLTVLSVAILFARPERGWMECFLSNSPAGLIMRQMFPAGIVIPVGLGALFHAARLSGLQVRQEAPILIVLSVACFGLFLRNCVSAVNKLDASRRVAETNLQKSEERLRMALDAAKVGTWDMDVRTKVGWWSETFDEIFGFPEGTLQQHHDTFLQFVHPEDREMVNARVMRTAHGLEDSFYIEHRIVRSDGTVRWVRAQGRLMRDANGEPVNMTGTVMDITERRLLEAELLEASNREQRRLGQDLHDDLGQWLTGMHLEARALAMRLKAKSEAEGAHAERLAVCAREALERTRMISRGLAPAVIESGGLCAALEELAANTERMFRVACECTCTDGLSVKRSDAALHLYRIAQEALSNALRHGQATRVEIILERLDDGRKRLVIRDNGSGIVHSGAQRPGLGMRIIQYRVESLSAKVEFGLAEGGGTEVRCCFSGEL